jgi:hypothetical protein
MVDFSFFKKVVWSMNNFTFMMNRYILTLALIVFSLHYSYAQSISNLLSKVKTLGIDKAINLFESKSAISTTFDDARTEVLQLENFEPNESAFTNIQMMPKDEKGGYKLSSGLYKMKAKSFCLKGYSYGPSKGDGHLYAPLKGPRSELITEIIRAYGIHPEVKQEDVQVLLWAIIAGTDINKLASKHINTFHQLFGVEQFTRIAARDYAKGYTTKQIKQLKKLAGNKLAPQLKPFFDANQKINEFVTNDIPYDQIERIAVLAGVAPAKDMIREVSKGRWSYHPDGYFIRYFPNGYKVTEVEIFVPYKSNIALDKKGNISKFKLGSDSIANVTYDPSKMAAVPANRSSQRIGISPLPVDDVDCFFEGVGGIVGVSQNLPEEVDCNRSKVQWINVTDVSKCNSIQKLELTYDNVEIGSSVINNTKSDYHCYYVENVICDMKNCTNCNEQLIYNLMLAESNRIAPIDSKNPVVDCMISDVKIPCTNDNPLLTTLHPDEYSIINHTLRYDQVLTDWNNIPYVQSHSHFLHPGKVQRKVFKDGNQIKVATMGDGNGMFGNKNVKFAKRVWGAVDGRLLQAFKCE